ncbi:MAG TPA: hypothetical protein VLA99_08525 [Nitrospiraceae bacterium]|nr:hypothetical protein [Nitrospiraceae bacterium]
MEDTQEVRGGAHGRGLIQKRRIDFVGKALNLYLSQEEMGKLRKLQVVLSLGKPENEPSLSLLTRRAVQVYSELVDRLTSEGTVLNEVLEIRGVAVRRRA